METAILKKTISGIMLGSLLLAAGCAGGGYEVYQPPPPSYYPRPYHPPTYYYEPLYPDQDPQFWQQWQNNQGGGG
jgi:hypothetical protein